MSASIRFNSFPGPLQIVAGAVALSNFNNTGVLGWHWELLDRPSGSAAAISSPFAAAPSFTADTPGSYRVRLRTYLDAGRTVLDATDIQIAFILFSAPYTWRKPAAGETQEADVSRGWATALDEIIDDLRTFVGGGGGGSGDVVGPASSADTAIVRFDGTTGKLVQNSLITVSDAGQVLGVAGSVAIPTFAFAASGAPGSFHGLYEHPTDAVGYGLGVATENGTVCVFSDDDGIMPGLNNNYSIGKSAFKWRNVFAYTAALADGAVATPAYTFDADPNTGFYRIGAGIVGTAADGVDVVRFQAPSGTNPQALFEFGSITAPSIGWNGRAGGIYSISATAMGFALDQTTSSVSLSRVTGGQYALDATGAAATLMSLRCTQTGGAVSLTSRVTTAATVGATFDQISSTAFSGSTPAQAHVAILSTINQTSTAGFTSLRVNQTQTALGSGSQYFLDLQVAGTSAFAIESSTAGAGRVLGNVGSATRPSYSFLGDTDTGMYQGGANVIAWAVAGAQAMYLGQFQLVIPTGFNAATPGLTFVGDTDTGVYWRAANELGLSAGGGGRVYLTTTAFLPEQDSLYTLGSAALRWSDVFAVQTTIGDLTMRDPRPKGKAREQIAHWKLVEDLDGIVAYNIRTGVKYVLAMEPQAMDDDDRRFVREERERWEA